MSWIFSLAAWGLLFLVVWEIGALAWKSVQSAKRMHQIPCANCQFFTNSSYLKCPIHPNTALTEEAIGCRDYYPEDQVFKTRY